jgi:AraC-like DNA-binding protein
MTILASVRPRGELARFVNVLWVSPGAVTTSEHIRLPDGQAELLFRVTDGRRDPQTLDSSSNRGDVHAIGPSTRPVRKVLGTVPHVIVVRFRPGGAYPFFGRPMKQMTDQFVPIEDLWGDDGTRLRDGLLQTSSAGAQLDLLERTLLARLRGSNVFEPASARIAQIAIRRITGATFPLRIDALADELGISQRQLRRVFDEVVGMGPKSFARIRRFRRAVDAASSAAVSNWADIATATGYYDQAHLIADFRQLAGATPGALLRRSRSGDRAAEAKASREGRR